MATSLLSKSPRKHGYSTFHDETTTPTPPTQSLENASWISTLLFAYARPVLDVGKQRQLEMEDLWTLEGENRTHIAYTKFKRNYLKHNKSVVRAMVATYGWRYVGCGIGAGTMAACAVFAPAVLHHVIDAFASPVLDTESLFLWVGAFFASRLLNAFCQGHVNFALEITLLRMTVSLKSLIFEKSMRRSIESKNEKGMVDVSNLFTADMDNLMWSGFVINTVWITPIQLGVVVYMLYYVLDLAAFAGLGVMFFSMFMNYLVANSAMDAYNVILGLKDDRMKTIKEVFGAIQIVKFNAWEDKFLRRIMQWRLKEIASLAKHMYLMALSIFLFWSTPICVSAVSFATYALVLGKELAAAKVFTAMVLFNSIREPLSEFPEALQSVLQAKMSIERITKFLDAEEVHPERLSRDGSAYDNEVMISVEDATFAWKKAKRTSSDDDESSDDEKKQCDNENDLDSELAGVATDDTTTGVTVLSDVNLTVKRGDFVVVHGAVGSGKSSLCAALLGELPSASGKVFVRSESVAYYSQQAWIQNMTIRDNILFGLPYDAKKYERVIDACGLVTDLKQFPAGDATEIGQKGVNLSGGQKARVSLARACYADADIYVLDSPLAAVDAVVQSEIFNKCLCKLLESKTVILVTHIHDIIETEAANVKVLIKDGVASVTRVDRTKSRSAYANLHTGDDLADSVSAENDVIDNCEKRPMGRVGEGSSGVLIDDEDREAGGVSKEVFLAYFEALGGIKVAVVYVAILITWQCFQVSSDVWLSHWTGGKGDVETSASVQYNISVYAALGLGTAVLVFCRAMTTAYAGICASCFLFENMTKSLLHSPLRFFDANPIGRIINRYAEDMATIDFHLPFNFFGVLVSFAISFFQLLTALYVIKYAGILIVPLAYIYVQVGVFYLSTSREVSRLLKISTSPILSHLSESEEGVPILRAYGQSYVDRAIEENFTRIDANNRVWFAQTVVNQWFAIRIQMIGFCMVVLVVSTLLALREYLSPGLVGLAFMYAVNIDSEMSYMVRNWSWLEISMVSPERVMEYVGLEAEGEHTNSGKLIVSSPPSPQWPQHGTITFDNVVFAYKPGASPVLKGLSFAVRENEKIGIVGRTGAGKSSLTMALFRINELESGRIVIDGEDISTLPLQTLRSHMSIIPQVPVLFKGTMRAYMDPFEEYSDGAIWSAFEKVSLKEMVSALEGKLDHELSENGENFSVGERQLLCLARALLRQSRIVVMDEATASIDRATEKKLQEMISREFKDATVLTIAHRLATVLDSDRILVLDNGRVAEFDTPKRLALREGGVFRQLAQEGGYLKRLLEQ